MPTKHEDHRLLYQNPDGTYCEVPVTLDTIISISDKHEHDTPIMPINSGTITLEVPEIPVAILGMIKSHIRSIRRAKRAKEKARRKRLKAARF